jgi:hypothetical protein
MTTEVMIVILYFFVAGFNLFAAGLCYFNLFVIWDKEKHFNHMIHILGVINILCVILNSCNAIKYLNLIS